MARAKQIQPLLSMVMLQFDTHVHLNVSGLSCLFLFNPTNHPKKSERGNGARPTQRGLADGRFTAQAWDGHQERINISCSRATIRCEIRIALAVLLAIHGFIRVLGLFKAWCWLPLYQIA